MLTLIRCGLLIITACSIVQALAQRVLPIGSGLSPSALGGVFDLEEYDGQLIIAGGYNTFNGNVRPSIQGWDGAQHYNLPGAFEYVLHQVRALQLFNGGLIAGGYDPTIGNVAFWDGNSWSAMGNGVSGRVNAMVEFNGDIHVAGQDSSALRWTGSNWVPVGERFNDVVNSLVVWNGELYAAGKFTGTQNSGTSLGRIAKWSGVEWINVGAGFNGEVLSMKDDPSGLLIGGTFTYSSDSSFQFPQWARFNNGIFEPIPMNPMGSVQGFHRLPDGRLLVGGDEIGVVENNMMIGRVQFQWMRDVREYQGMTLVAGKGDALGGYSFTGSMGRMAEGCTFAELDINDVRPTIVPMATGFFRPWNVGPGFEVPAGDGVHAIYSTAPWIFAYENGVRHVSVPFYWNQSNLLPANPWAGPQANVMDETYYDRYHRVWKVDRAVVQQHIANWNVPGYVQPEVIANWPGNGDLANGEPAILAPFVDLNGNEIYEPSLGDYPLIKGDQAIYSIQHTVDDPFYDDGQGGLLPLEFDVHAMFYGFESVNPALDQTVFVNYRIVNRENTAYDSVRFGQFTDLDIGCPNNDFAGCDSTRNMYFAYNWEDNDISCLAQLGYGPQPPAAGVKFLNEPMLSHRTYPREGVHPTLDDLMYGMDLGQPFMDTGYPSRYQFPGGDFAEQYPTPAQPDRRSVGATGPFSMAPGDTLCFDIAFIYARAPSGGAYASAEALKVRSDSVEQYFNGLNYSCNEYPVMTGVEEGSELPILSLYPNPARDRLMVSSTSPLGYMNVLDIQGRIVLSASTLDQRIEIDISKLSRGMYTVIIRSGSANRAIKFVLE